MQNLLYRLLFLRLDTLDVGFTFKHLDSLLFVEQVRVLTLLKMSQTLESSLSLGDDCCVATYQGSFAVNCIKTLGVRRVPFICVRACKGKTHNDNHLAIY